MIFSSWEEEYLSLCYPVQIIASPSQLNCELLGFYFGFIQPFLRGSEILENKIRYYFVSKLNPHSFKRNKQCFSWLELSQL